VYLFVLINSSAVHPFELICFMGSTSAGNVCTVNISRQTNVHVHMLKNSSKKVLFFLTQNNYVSVVHEWNLLKIRLFTLLRQKIPYFVVFWRNNGCGRRNCRFLMDCFLEFGSTGWFGPGARRWTICWFNSYVLFSNGYLLLLYSIQQLSVTKISFVQNFTGVVIFNLENMK
jgi:hypothetical protein